MSTDQMIAELELIEKRSGRAIQKVIEVEVNPDKTFAIATAYENKVGDLGFRIGSMCSDQPRALSRTANYIAKWRNISLDEYCKMDGVVFCSDNRNGNHATIVILG